MPNVYRKIKKKGEHHPCDFCDNNWHCQIDDSKRADLRCFQELMEKLNKKDGIKISMFY